MRKALEKEEGKRKKFSAVFGRLGSKKNYHGYSEETVLLKDITDLETNQIVADHLWFGFSKGFQEARLSAGDMLEFEARIKEYKKGYVNPRYGINQRKLDYKLSHPTKIKILRD